MLKKVVLSLFVVLFCGSLAFAQGSWALDRAKDAMNRGEYSYAIREFRSIANSSSNTEPVQREAAYYIGFCYVKLSDMHEAVRSYEGFLRRFDRYNATRFIPDALYVLGQCYERISRPEDAARKYSDCRRRFPHTDYGRKAADRLKTLGYIDYYDGGNNHHDNYNGISQQIHDIVRLAKDTHNSYDRDNILLRGASKARSAADYTELMRYINNDYTRGQLLIECQESKTFRYMNIDEIVRLAKYCQNSYTRDQFYLEAAKKVARVYDDFRILMKNVSNDYTRSQIRQLAENAIGGHWDAAAPVRPVFSNEKQFADSRDINNPFEGMQIDEERIQRVNNFIEAVEKRENMRDAARKLSPEDLSLDSVRQSWHIFKQIENFQQIHENVK